MFSMESLAVAFAAFEVAWLLSIPLWQTRLPAGRILAGLGVGWIVAVALIAWRGYFRLTREIFPPLELCIGLIGFVAVFLVVASIPAVSTVSRALGARTFVAIQIFRGLVGAAFLSMASRSWIAPTFGYGVGVVETLVGVTAIALIFAMSRLDSDRRRRWVLGWSIASTLLLLVGPTLWTLSVPSEWQHFGEGALLSRLSDFPFALVPAFIWPAALLGNAALILRDERF